MWLISGKDFIKGKGDMKGKEKVFSKVETGSKYYVHLRISFPTSIYGARQNSPAVRIDPEDKEVSRPSSPRL